MPNYRPELSLINSHEASEISPGFIDPIHEAVEPMIKDYRIDETDFLSIYDPVKVENDIKKVKEREKWFSKNDTQKEKLNKKCADILEYTVFDLLKADDWMHDFIDEDGDEIDPEIAAETSLASRYDDLFNGADIIFKSGGAAGSSQVSVFSIDTTFSHNKDSLDKKNWDRRNLLRRDDLARIEYYQSGNFTGKIENLPRFIIGTDKLQTLKLARYLYVDRSSLSSEEATDLRSELGYKVVTQLLVESIAMQQLAREKYTKKKLEGNIPDKLVNTYNNLTAAQNYFAQAHDKMSLILERDNGQPYKLKNEDIIHDNIINYYHNITKKIEKYPATKRLGAGALDAVSKTF